MLVPLGHLVSQSCPCFWRGPCFAVVKVRLVTLWQNKTQALVRCLRRKWLEMSAKWRFRIFYDGETVAGLLLRLLSPFKMKGALSP